jgi:NTE family protein
MSIPSAFAPVEIEGHLLVDGGIVNNIPVDVVRNMGADIVIAIDIANPLQQVDSSSSFVTIAEQSLDISLIQNTLLSLQKADIVIIPELGNLARTDFDKGPELIAKGYEAIMKKSHLFKRLAIKAVDYAHYQAKLRERTPSAQEVVVPTFIEITGNQRISSVILKNKLGKLIGRELYFDDLQQATARLMSLSEVEQVTYDVTKNAQGEKGLLFDVHEKSWGPNYFRFGMNASTTFDNKTEFTVLLRHERLNINRLGGEWVNKLEIGTGSLFGTEFYQPLDYNQRFFVMPFANMQRSFIEVFKEGSGIAEYDIENLQLGLDMGINLSNRVALRVGMQNNNKNAKLRIGNSAILPTGDIRENLLTFKFGYDSLDDWLFAKQGTAIDIEGNIYDQRIGSDTSYQQLLFHGRQHVPIYPHTILISELTLATSLQSTLPEYEYFSIGGFDKLAGYLKDEVSGKHAAVVRIGGLFNPLGLPRLGAVDTKLLGLLHVGNAWEEYSNISIGSLHYGGLAAIVWNTRFGAIVLGMGYTDGGSLRYNLSLGSFF